MAPLPSPGDGPPGAVDRPRIRRAVPADLPAVAAIFAPYVTGTAVTFAEDPPSAADWSDRLEDADAGGLPFLVAELDGAVVGYAYVTPWRPRAAYRHTVEDTIYLAPAAQGRGVGTRLLSALLDACTVAGIRQVVAVVADDPAGAGSVPLHRRLGFEVVGVLRDVGRKHGRDVSTMLMQRTLH
ncbi:MULTISPECIES: GNAT family N-acetyltransferase [unclassified Isoptericola]|uniref:GNAT family N-acetyltransferase n=1 Tax=unclassified Isoptericola TaxID=2623355 RepID=UPI002712EA5D|nr:MULTISPECIES: GNAT family N-acetyltransferase [unclassified Isoptericola]MDO8144786.1 N-acetyltransferase family protein [Isoptericola sp. 178]MDO8149566.1 N-acetyltransferase family protein [Isoptericola sp. b515]